MKTSISVTYNECRDTFSSLACLLHTYQVKKKKKKNKTANEYIVQCESISNTFMYKAAGIQCKH